jgi:hypothetical protein
MMRFIVDARAVLHLASQKIDLSDEHECSHRRSCAHRPCRRFTRRSSAARCRPTWRATSSVVWGLRA